MTDSLDARSIDKIAARAAQLHDLAVQLRDLTPEEIECIAGGGWFDDIVRTVSTTLPVIGSMLSDIRVKRDVAPLGRIEGGLGLYRYRYLWSERLYVGVMAQEVAVVRPDAVHKGRDGYLRVDYARLGRRLETWEAWRATH